MDARSGGRVDGRTIVGRGVTAAVVAAVANGALAAVARAALDLTAFPPLEIQRVVLFTVVGVVGAAVVYGVLRRTVSNPDRAFAVVAAVALVLSFVPDLTIARSLPGATTAGIVLLMVMHVVAAVVAVAVLIRGVPGNW